LTIIKKKGRLPGKKEGLADLICERAEGQRKKMEIVTLPKGRNIPREGKSLEEKILLTQLRKCDGTRDG